VRVIGGVSKGASITVTISARTGPA
jgi:hypothetical protein